MSNKMGAHRCPPETMLLHAKLMAVDAGISDVTDITDLDRMGVPVFVSARPSARADVFTYGKGLSRVEAEVGAYLETLELFYAGSQTSEVQTRWGTARDVAGSDMAEDAVLDFVPMLHCEADLDARMLLASVQELGTGAECALPAELVFYPAPAVGPSLYGPSTNGLASGNTLAGASIHGLLELIERDIWSFEFLRRGSRLVDPSTLPEEVRAIVERAERAGLRLKIRTIPNEYGLPFFAAFLFDEKEPRLETFNGGWACDLDRSAALVRAVTESAQSRLAFIHGGRKVRRERPGPGRSAFGSSERETAEEASVVRRHIGGVSDARGQTAFTDVPSVDVPDCLPDHMAAVIARVRRVTEKPIYRAVFTPPGAVLQVVRMVVPLLENFKPTRARVGRRLKAELDVQAVQAV